jgi:hypothetical protein
MLIFWLPTLSMNAGLLQNRFHLSHFSIMPDDLLVFKKTCVETRFAYACCNKTSFFLVNQKTVFLFLL